MQDRSRGIYMAVDVHVDTHLSVAILTETRAYKCI